MKLKEYNSLAEKGAIASIAHWLTTEPMTITKNHHISIRINTLEDVDQMFKALGSLMEHDLQKTQKQILFRGISESKYNTYTSAQRYWLTNELFKRSDGVSSQISFNQFIQYLIDKTKIDRDELLLKIYKNNSEVVTDLTFLSFIQHYEGPSPLLDVTYNPYKALFFCFDNSNYTPSDKEIDNYCSLYCINCIWCSGQNEMASLPLLVRDANGDREAIERICSYQELVKHPAVIVRKDFVDGSIAPICIENHNLISQEGAFLFYPNHERPLDDLYDSEESNLGYIFTFEIHKSLKECILNRLVEKKITHDTIYPDLKQIAKAAYIKYLKGES